MELYFIMLCSAGGTTINIDYQWFTKFVHGFVHKTPDSIRFRAFFYLSIVYKKARQYAGLNIVPRCNSGAFATMYGAKIENFKISFAILKESFLSNSKLAHVSNIIIPR